MCTNLPQEITEDMLAVLFQQCVLGPDYALSGSPTVTPSGIKVSKQRKLLGLLLRNTRTGDGGKRSAGRILDQKRMGNVCCIHLKFHLSLVIGYSYVFAEMKDNHRSHYFCKALRISFPTGAADAGFWPVIRRPSTMTLGCTLHGHFTSTIPCNRTHPPRFCSLCVLASKSRNPVFK